MSPIAPTPWQSVVDSPAAGDHVVQMYRDPRLLVEVVARYGHQGLVTGDRERFFGAITPYLEHVRHAGYERIRLYGEMVELLRPAAFAVAMRLEELWHELLETERHPLLCAYHVDTLDRHDGATAVAAIARRHSHVLPADDADRFERAVERAFLDVFGTDADTLLLRQLCERHGALATTMPTAQAVLLNLDELMPYLGDAVRAAAAHHYRVGAR